MVAGGATSTLGHDRAATGTDGEAAASTDDSFADGPFVTR